MPWKAKSIVTICVVVLFTLVVGAGVTGAAEPVLRLVSQGGRTADRIYYSWSVGYPTLSGQLRTYDNAELPSILAQGEQARRVAFANSTFLVYTKAETDEALSQQMARMESVRGEIRAEVIATLIALPSKILTPDFERQLADAIAARLEAAYKARFDETQEKISQVRRELLNEIERRLPK